MTTTSFIFYSLLVWFGGALSGAWLRDVHRAFKIEKPIPMEPEPDAVICVSGFSGVVRTEGALRAVHMGQRASKQGSNPNMITPEWFWSDTRKFVGEAMDSLIEVHRFGAGEFDAGLGGREWEEARNRAYDLLQVELERERAEQAALDANTISVVRALAGHDDAAPSELSRGGEE